MTPLTPTEQSYLDRNRETLKKIEEANAYVVQIDTEVAECRANGVEIDRYLKWQLKDSREAVDKLYAQLK